MLIWDEFELPLAPPCEANDYIYVRYGRQLSAQTPLTMVFLHEALGSIAQWRDFPEQLAERCGCDVLVYDRVGHGKACPLQLPRSDDYLAFEGEQVLPQLLKRLRVERAVLVGHSDGGSIALVGAAVEPERVVGLITEAAHLFVEPETRSGIEAARTIYPQILQPGLRRYHGDKTDTLFDAWWQTWLRQSYQALDLRPWLGGIRQPALIIQGYEDEYGTPRQVDEICAGIGSSAEPCWLEAAHIPHREARDACLTAMASFVERLGVSRSQTASATHRFDEPD